jgi:hypothetical protein
VQLDRWIGVAEGFLRQPDVSGIIFNHQNIYRQISSSDDTPIGGIGINISACWLGEDQEPSWYRVEWTYRSFARLRFENQAEALFL